MSPRAFTGSRWLVEDFESPQGTTGGFWCAVDDNGLGTRVEPMPFALTPGGAPPSPGHGARYFGAIGEDRAPYSWAQLQVFLDRARTPQDLTRFRSVHFWAKGDGGRYSVALAKQAVADYDHFKQEFVVGRDWTPVALPFERFVQAGWGKKVPAVFDDVVQIQFSPAGFGHAFELSVDHVELRTDEVSVTPVAYPTTSWFAYSGTDPEKRRGSALDVSRLLDAPAGKYGPVARRGENFTFAGGKRIRFWGVNLVGSANFPNHADADRLAELLAQLGVNMTRHHHLDASWANPNLFGNTSTTQALDSDALERFDYLVAALQKRGIYQFFDLLVHRQLGPADPAPARADLAPGLKIEGEFVPALIELQERFIEQLMGHRNPYTRQRYATDPAIALVDVINEDSLFWIQKQGDFAITSPEYRKLFDQLFSSWLLKHVPGGRAVLEKRWQASAGGQGLAPNEDPERGDVNALVQFAGDDPKRLSQARAEDTLRFYYDTALGYYRRIRSKLQQLGYRALVTGSNHWSDSSADLFANAQLDFVDRHAYWAHPNGGWGYSTEISWEPGSMLKDAGLGVVGALASKRVKGLPFTASEWQTAAPNDYRHEGVLTMGAYAALGNFSALQFAFSHEASKRSQDIARLTNNFDVVEQPTVLGAWPAVSLLFHRRDVAEARQENVLRVDERDVFDPLFRSAVPKELARQGKTGVGFGQGQSWDELRRTAARSADGVAKANGGELVHDAKRGTLLVDTARSQAFAGFLPSEPVKLRNVELSLRNPFAVVMVTALDDQPLAASGRILVSALGNAVNSGMTLAPARNRLEDAGKPPVLVEPIVGRLSLVGLSNRRSFAVYALGPNGERDHLVEVTQAPGSASFELSARHRTMHYEIVRQ